MRLEAAGLDHSAGLAHHARQSKALFPVAVLWLEQLPIVGSELIKDHNFCAQFLAHLECALLAHDLARIAHTAAVAHGERTCTHGFELAHKSDKRVFMRG